MDKSKYLVVKILTYQKKNPPRIEKVGFILQDLDTNKTIGCTFDEAFAMIEKDGSTNTETLRFTQEEHGYEGRTIQPKEGLDLPTFNDPTWHISIFADVNQKDYTDELQNKIEQSLKGEMNWNFEVLRRKWKQENRNLFADLYSQEMKEKYRQLAESISGAQNIVVFSGDEITNEVGFPNLHIPTVNEMKNREVQNESPELLLQSYQDRFVSSLEDVLPEKSTDLAAQAIENFRPTSIHQFFSSLEKKGKNVSIFTTEIDGLHKKAGSARVFPLNGEITNLYCHSCHNPASIHTVFVEGTIHCEQEDCNGIYLPAKNVSIVQLLDIANKLVSEADLLIYAGADTNDSFIKQINLQDVKAKNIIINHKKGNDDTAFDLALYGSIGTILKEVEQKLSSNTPVCSVCGENAAEGLYATRIAPTNAYYCQSCIELGAEPYDVFVTKVALSKKRNADYQLSPRHQHFLESTLKVTKKSREQFDLDIEKRLQDRM